MSTIQTRRGTAAAWVTADPVLALGEMGIETDTLQMKVGDGSTDWDSLPYLISGALTASRAVISNGSSVLASSGTSDTELGYVTGVTSAIQAQINAKAAAPTTVSLTTQGASISATTITGTAGMYLLSYVIEETSSGSAGTVTVTFTWTDDSGSTSVTSASVVLTGAGRASGTVPLVLASGNLQYATTCTGLIGSPKYALKIAAMRMI